MSKSFVHQNIYPNFRHIMSLGRKGYNTMNRLKNPNAIRPTTSKVLPDTYRVCNTTTSDSDYDLHLLDGTYPDDLDGSMYITQCLGVPDAFMVGDTNLVRLDFNQDRVSIMNRFMWTPAAMARHALKNTKHRFDYFGLMYLSPGLGLFSYTEGMYLLPDGRLSVTSDVDRPWIIDKKSLRATSPIGRRKEWLPMMADKAGEVMGDLFSAYSNSHVMYPDRQTNETFFVNYQYKQADGSHPVHLMVWDGYNNFKQYKVIDEYGHDIEIKQSIHELIFTRDYILLADTAFIAGTEMLTPWKNAPLPNDKTVVYIVDRRHLKTKQTVTAVKVTVDEACIHLIAEYENPNDQITVYMLHTPATNTAEILKRYDRDLKGQLFPEHLIGYGTLPVLDLSSVGKHVIDMSSQAVLESRYLRDENLTWGPYLYTYMNRQVDHFNKQDLFIMFKGFDKNILPKRIFDAYHDVKSRHIPVEELLNNKVRNNNSIVRIATDRFEIADAYEMPDGVLLYTISCIQGKTKGYVLAGVALDSTSPQSSGHEYWIFDSQDLSKGPLCKLGHEALNNSTIFHTIFISSEQEAELQARAKTYHVPLREDYPKEEILKWDPCVLETFDKIIWPYFEGQEVRELDRFKRTRVDTSIGKEDLMGERSFEDAAAFADQMVEEANRLWTSTGWSTTYKKKDLHVEVKPICGDLELSGVHVTRSIGRISAPAQDTFHMLISPEGYGVIDPVSKKDDHIKPPLEIYEWKPNSRLEAALATTNLPMMPASEFVVLNAIDQDAMTFVSKSILHDKVPGGSKYSKHYDPSTKERALNTFAIKVIPIDDQSCEVLCINYADICGKSTPGMNNFVNKKLFFPPLYKRIQKTMHEKAL